MKREVVFGILAVVRVAGALNAPIQDCDEVFNYWEPLHFLQFGYGKQTWEYAPQYALRSFWYLHIYDTLVRAMHLVVGFTDRSQVFFGLRLALCLVSAVAETLLVSRTEKHAGKRAANYLLLALVGMPGLYHAAGALLPSSFAMQLGTIALSLQPSRQKYLGWMIPLAVGAMWGWPYAGILAVPQCVEQIMSFRQLPRFILTGLVVGILALLVMGAVDSYYYGTFVMAAWNQLRYNVGSNSSSLYGTEPWHFYLQNGLLNGSLMFPLALLTPFLWLTNRRMVGPSKILVLPLTLSVLSMVEHKEERFLSIVYPHIALNAALTLDMLRPLIGSRLSWTIILAGVVLGALRMAALSQFYGIPVTRLFASIPKGTAQELLALGPSIRSLWKTSSTEKSTRQTFVCMGQDWYRFPSHYLLPDSHHLMFLQAKGFDGHLPGDFASTNQVREDFNDRNQWEPTHAWVTPDHCDYLVEITDAHYPGWTAVSCQRMLDPQRTPVLSRVLYLAPGQVWTRLCLFSKNS